MSGAAAMKRCSSCREVKSIDGFARNRSQRDGRTNQCKKCNRAYRESHKSSIAEYQKSYRENHREDRKERDRAYYVANREKVAERNREYHHENRERRNARNRDMYALVGNPSTERKVRVSMKFATHGGRGTKWTVDEDAYLIESADRIIDDAISLKRTYYSVAHRLRTLRARGVTLARDSA